jgi:hypothetical protein
MFFAWLGWDSGSAEIPPQPYRNQLFTNVIARVHSKINFEHNAKMTGKAQRMDMNCRQL